MRVRVLECVCVCVSMHVRAHVCMRSVARPFAHVRLGEIPNQDVPVMSNHVMDGLGLDHRCGREQNWT